METKRIGKRNMKESLAAKAVANDVIEKVRKGGKINLQDIQKKHGYSDTSAKSMKATRTMTYKRATASLDKDILDEIGKIRREMKKRDISEEKYKDLADVLEKLFKVHQLLSGGATENVSDMEDRSVVKLIIARIHESSST